MCFHTHLVEGPSPAISSKPCVPSSLCGADPAQQSHRHRQWLQFSVSQSGVVGGGAWHIWEGACTTPPRQRLVTRQLALCSAHAHRGASDVSEGVDGGSPYTAQDHLCSLKCSGPVCFSPPGQPRLDLEHPLMTYTELVSLHVWGHPHSNPTPTKHSLQQQPSSPNQAHPTKLPAPDSN